MSFGDYLEGKILDHIFSESSYTAPTWYVALSTADPGEDGSTIAEPSGGSYARKALGATTRSGGSVTNDADVEFAQATGDWGTITHFAFYDALSGGNFLGSDELDSSQAVDNGDTARFAAGTLTISLT